MFTGTTENWESPASGTGEAPASGSGGGSPSGGAPSTGGGGESAPASTPAPATPAAPANAVEALQRAEAALTAASSPAAPGTAGGASVPAPKPPATVGAAAPVPSPSPAGPVPFDRHEAAVRNARAEGAREAAQQFSWLRETNLDQPAIQRYLDLGRRLDSDPAAFARDLSVELNGASGPGTGQELDDLIDPEPDLVDSTGTKKTYSEEANRQVAANAAERMRRQLMQELAPVLEYVQGSRDRDDMAAIRQEGQQSATQIVDTLSTYPHWDLKKVGAIYTKLDPSIRQKWGVPAAMLIAYNKYMAEQVLPTLGQRERQATVVDMQRSAAAGTIGAVVPPPPAAPKRVIREGNIDDIAKLMRDKEAALNATP